jgi:integrase
MASIRSRVRDDGSRSYQVRGPGIPTRTFLRKAAAEEYRVKAENRRRSAGMRYVEPAAAELFGVELDRYIARKEAHGRQPSTLRALRETAHVLRPLRSRPVPELRRDEVEDLLTGVASRAPRRAQMACGLVKAVLRAAQERGQFVDVAIFRIERPRVHEREPVLLDLDQVDELASWMPEHIRRVVPFAALTGMRAGELLSLRDAQLDLRHGDLWIPRGKTAAARRRVILPAEAVTLLREQLLARAPGVKTNEERLRIELVFAAWGGGVFDRNRLMERHFRPAAVAAGLGTFTVRHENGKRREHYDGPTLHDLRHTAISLMATAGWRPEHIAEQVGHTDGGVLILRRYRHLFPDEMEQQRAKLDALVSGGRQVDTASSS